MSILRFLFLAPLSFIFFIVVWFRNFLFDGKIFRSQKFPVRLISIGNLSAGGTGKTPLTAAVAQKLKDDFQQKAAIVSRGYKGSYSSESERVDIQNPAAAAIYGDEPTWYAKQLNLPVYVGRRRSCAVAQLLKDTSNSIDVVIADDAFQHRWLSRDLDIVLIDATDNQIHMLPLGRRREPLSSLSRANIVVLTKVDGVDSEDKAKMIQQVGEYGFSEKKKNLFLLNYKLSVVYRLNHPEQKKNLSSLSGKKAMAASIARPDYFKKMLESQIQLTATFVFPDHHLWSQADADHIIESSIKSGFDVLIVTEKDEVKMRNLNWKSLQIFIAPLEIEFESGSEDFYKKVAKEN